MGKGTELMDVEIGKILALHEEGHSKRYIAKAVNRSRTCVSNLIKRDGNLKSNKRTGRPKILKNIHRRRICRLAATSKYLLRKIVHEINFKAGYNTIRSTIRSNDFLKYTKINVKPPLKYEHKMDRISFAREALIQKYSWEEIIFYR